MTKFSKKTICSLAVCVLLLLSIVLALRACTKDDGFPKPPLSFPLSLEKAGNKIETNLRVVDCDAYYFRLEFSFDENDKGDRARVRKLTGDDVQDKSRKDFQPGVPNPVLLRVSSLEAGEEHEIYVKEIDPMLSSWGADSFAKIICFVRLEPGLYKVELKNLRSSPEFNGTPVTFTITDSGLH